MYDFVSQLDSGDQCYLKHRDFGYQCEYRFIWETGLETQDYIFISVPEAREFCTRLEDLEVENINE